MSPRRNRSASADGIRIQETVRPHDRHMAASTLWRMALRFALPPSNFMPIGHFKTSRIRAASARLGRVGCVVRLMCWSKPPWAASAEVLTSAIARSLNPALWNLGGLLGTFHGSPIRGDSPIIDQLPNPHPLPIASIPPYLRKSYNYLESVVSRR